MKKRIIGITGSFGSGKTTVSKMFGYKKNCLIIDADKIAKRAYKNIRIAARIKKEFGTIQRGKLACIVFNDREKLQQLNKIIHPYVFQEISKEIKRAKKDGKTVILDVPLLFESGLDKICDMVILVKCRKDKQIKRLKRKGFSKEEIIKRIKTQMPLKQKAHKSDYIIINSGELAETKMHVKEIREKIMG